MARNYVYYIMEYTLHNFVLKQTRHINMYPTLSSKKYSVLTDNIFLKIQPIFEHCMICLVKKSPLSRLSLTTPTTVNYLIWCE